MTETHKQLQDTAIRWLYQVGCNVFAKEVPTQNGIADALGIKSSLAASTTTDTAKQLMTTYGLLP